jgi:biotin carboxyl carrier protein
MYSCQQGLSPRALIADFKIQMKEKGVSIPKVEGKPEAVSTRELKRVPLSRLSSRLGLDKYNVPAPISDLSYTPKNVRIFLSQHIGVPASPIVKIGDSVSKNDVIAVAPDNKLGVNIHSSVNGTVEAITDKYIIIKTIGGVQ